MDFDRDTAQSAVMEDLLDYQGKCNHEKDGDKIDTAFPPADSIDKCLSNLSFHKSHVQYIPPNWVITPLTFDDTLYHSSQQWTIGVVVKSLRLQSPSSYKVWGFRGVFTKQGLSPLSKDKRSKQTRYSYVKMLRYARRADIFSQRATSSSPHHRYAESSLQHVLFKGAERPAQLLVGPALLQDGKADLI